MFRFSVFAFIVCFVLSGCSNYNSNLNAKTKENIVDAVFTVYEYSPKDRTDRVAKYLDKKVATKQLSTEERFIIDLCIKRSFKNK